MISGERMDLFTFETFRGESSARFSDKSLQGFFVEKRRFFKNNCREQVGTNARRGLIGEAYVYFHRRTLMPFFETIDEKFRKSRLSHAFLRVFNVIFETHVFKSARVGIVNHVAGAVIAVTGLAHAPNVD